jgi:threonyl-tRNA synthetase
MSGTERRGRGQCTLTNVAGQDATDRRGPSYTLTRAARFYYDFLLPDPITPADFSRIEDRLAQIIRENQAFVREEYSIDEAVRLLLSLGEPLKAAFRRVCGQASLRQISFYRNGPFIDSSP